MRKYSQAGCLSVRNQHVSRSIEKKSKEKKAQKALVPGTVPLASKTLTHSLSTLRISSGKFWPPPTTLGLFLSPIGPSLLPAHSLAKLPSRSA
jgi:hypothetical protein